MPQQSTYPGVGLLHRVAIQVPDVLSAATFYRDIWQLQLTHCSDALARLRSSEADHDDLVLLKGVKAIEHVAFSVTSPVQLSALADALNHAGYATNPLLDDQLLPGETGGFAVTDPDDREVRVVLPGLATPAPNLADNPLAPLRMGHLVLWSPDVTAAEEFYTLLGFQVSDRTHLGMSFLRCNADHHTLALAKSAKGRTDIQHIAFDVGTLDNVMLNFGRLRTMGVECVWGVGRHGPGDNIFSYYADPAGNHVEYYGEMEKVSGPVTDPRYWGPEHKGDVWGVAGTPPPSFRE